MDIVKTYQQKVVESKEFIFILICLVAFLRLALFSYTDDLSVYSIPGNSVFGDLITTLFEKDSWLSFASATVFALSISFYCAYINIKHTLIRTKSYLVYSIVFIVLSSHTIFLGMNVLYIQALFFLLCIDILFGSYQQKRIANRAFTIGFIFAVSSLFSFYFLFYIIVFWIGFIFMRNLSFKNFLASLLGIISIYWLIFFYYLWLKDLNSYIALFTSVTSGFEFNSLTELLTLNQYITAIINISFLIIVISYYQFYSYLDKIRVRSMIYFLNLIAIIAILSCIFLNLGSITDLYVYSICYSFILAHFYSVANKKWQVILFCIFLIFTIISSIIMSLN